MLTTPGKFYSGTSGLVVPIPKTLYPPEFAGRSRLAYYSSLTNSIEINSTFYKLPRASTISNWSSDVPSHFRISVKLLKEISHAKALEYDPQLLIKFMEVANHAGLNKGALLIQFPPKLNIQMFSKVKELLLYVNNLAQPGDWQLAVEFRNESWYTEEVFTFFNTCNVNIVQHDLPRVSTPPHALTGSFKYLRFHGTEPGYRGSYTEQVLMNWASRITTWLNQGQDVYCYFNNTLGGAFTDLQNLNRLVAESLKAA